MKISIPKLKMLNNLYVFYTLGLCLERSLLCNKIWIPTLDELGHNNSNKKCFCLD